MGAGTGTGAGAGTGGWGGEEEASRRRARKRLDGADGEVGGPRGFGDVAGVDALDEGGVRGAVGDRDVGGGAVRGGEEDDGGGGARGGGGGFVRVGFARGLGVDEEDGEAGGEQLGLEARGGLAGDLVGVRRAHEGNAKGLGCDGRRRGYQEQREGARQRTHHGACGRGSVSSRAEAAYGPFG